MATGKCLINSGLILFVFGLKCGQQFKLHLRVDKEAHFRDKLDKMSPSQLFFVSYFGTVGVWHAHKLPAGTFHA